MQSETGAEPGGDAGRVAALVVDDDVAVRGLAVRILTEAGYTVVGAAGGDEAVEILDATGPVDVLVTDVVMPGMNGLELAAAARERRPAIAILVMSGYAPAVRDHDGFPFLAKPFTPDALLDAVAGVLTGEVEPVSRLRSPHGRDDAVRRPAARGDRGPARLGP